MEGNFLEHICRSGDIISLCIELASAHYKENKLPHILKVDYFLFGPVSKHYECKKTNLLVESGPESTVVKDFRNWVNNFLNVWRSKKCKALHESQFTMMLITNDIEKVFSWMDAGEFISLLQTKFAFWFMKTLINETKLSTQGWILH